jgi:hypothetical protein
MSTASTTKPGGYTDWQFPLTDEASQVFKTALKGRMGVGYDPVAFATQVIAGERYAFLTLGTATTHPARQLVAVIHVIKPLQGQAHIEGEIKEIPQDF